ncbi:MAG: leucine--tRNA ligase [Prevotellaceae bacterium]|jgi:leucyl-tRNA synthetase|nr:leucine--tRNA ligase [Prevotellaceae bacterium]
MEYNFLRIEEKWQKYWNQNNIYKTDIDKSKPKYYVLDMFPYPSGAGLHVGHPLGYIASDIYSRYKTLKGFNVLHPMGFDAFGLPAEQYAVETGQHPEITTEKNIKRYREQLDKLGFCYDWDREVKTCSPEYYKWTQWAFIRMFNSYYCNDVQQARPISELIAVFESEGSERVNAACNEQRVFTANEWNAGSEKEQQEILMNYRIAYLADTMVNWCADLGTVLANDEVVNGLSVRGGFPVEQRKMRQWSLRVSAYAQRLLDGLDTVEWTESLKETQKNWIGRSEGAEIRFDLSQQGKETPHVSLGASNSSTTSPQGAESIIVFTTRPDTIFGVTFMVLAPESEYVAKVVTPEHQAEVEAYIESTKRRTERERIADRKITGVFSGGYAINPFSGEEVPVWISDYVLAGYGTGAIMAVPAHDSRDYAFAKHFGLPVIPLIEDCDVSEESFDAKEGIMVNSGFLNGATVPEAIQKAKEYIRDNSIGAIKVNYRLRDAIFSRQRYWGEPFPVYYKDGMPYNIPEEQLPLILPEVDKFLPTETGEPPLGRAKNWTYNGSTLELSTMPGFAGSSAYYLRYMDPHNTEALVSKEADEYWRNVDLYIGGTEHATGHLIYSRFWNKFLYDIGAVVEQEPFKKLINQGMIQGCSSFVYRIKGSNTFVSYGLKDNHDVSELHVDVNIVNNNVLDIKRFKLWRPEYEIAEFILEDGEYRCGSAVEKMSKSLYNVVNPDDIVVTYGADTLRLYEMFLGPLEQSKPWDTKGIDGVHRFLRKFWRLFYHDNEFFVSDEAASKEELKVLHKTIKKVQSDIETFSFNTAVSAFMICVNELMDLKCNKKEILEPLTIILAPFAPHIAEELWHSLGNAASITKASFPEYNESFLVENSFEYPVSFNGKTRFKIELPLDADAKQIEETVLASAQTQKFLDGKQPKKVIVVKSRIVNIVV